MSSGGGQTGTTTTTSGPPSYLQPYVTYGAQQGQGLYQAGGPQYYPGSTVAAQSPATQAAQQGIAAAATNPTPAIGAGSNYLTGLLNGNYLTQGNPYQGAVNQSVYDAAIPGVESQMTLAGRGGSPSESLAATQEVADALAPQEYQNYGNTLNLMNQGAAWGVPSIANAPYGGLDQLAESGQAQDAYNQSLINAPMQQWNYNQQLPYNNLSQLMAWLGQSSYGGNSTTTQTQPSGGAGGLLGGLLGGIL